MLSEIKILIYVGENTNVVNLLGVCTQDIRNRNIHILLEFCEKGSLLNFLRKSQPNFINLIEDYASNVESGDGVKEEDHVTTLDLIRWSAEIANGMNYLSTKRVIKHFMCWVFFILQSI
jgi:serine/threonine protein kinase